MEVNHAHWTLHVQLGQIIKSPHSRKKQIEPAKTTRKQNSVEFNRYYQNAKGAQGAPPKLLLKYEAIAQGTIPKFLQKTMVPPDPA